MLRGNKLQKRGGLALAAALAANTRLRTLDLADTDMDVDCVAALRAALTANTALTSLTLDRPLLVNHGEHGEEAAVHMADLVARNATLRHLSLQKVRPCPWPLSLVDLAVAHKVHGTMQFAITDFGCTRLAEALVRNKTLQSLDLSWYARASIACKLDSGAPCGLPTTCSRPPAHVASTKFAQDGAAALAFALTRNPALQVLALEANRIEGPGAKALARALPAAISLQRCGLPCCRHHSFPRRPPHPRVRAQAQRAPQQH